MCKIKLINNCQLQVNVLTIYNCNDKKKIALYSSFHINVTCFIPAVQRIQERKFQKPFSTISFKHFNNHLNC
jgi:hypothetical protein